MVCPPRQLYALFGAIIPAPCMHSVLLLLLFTPLHCMPWRWWCRKVAWSSRNVVVSFEGVQCVNAAVLSMFASCSIWCCCLCSADCNGCARVCEAHMQDDQYELTTNAASCLQGVLSREGFAVLYTTSGGQWGSLITLMPCHVMCCVPLIILYQHWIDSARSGVC